MKSSLKARVTGPVVVALNCPLKATCRLMQDHHGVMMFDCRYLARVRGRQGDGETTVECYYRRLVLLPARPPAVLVLEGRA